MDTGSMIASSQQPALYAAFVGYIDRAPKTARTYTTNLRQFAAWTRYAGIDRPTRPDIIQYRDWLGTEHEAIAYAPDTLAGWVYRLDRTGNRQMITCKPNTIKQYLQSVKQFFSWAASEGYCQNVAANVHGPKVRDMHRKDSLAASDVVAIENSIRAQAEAREQAAFAAIKDIDGRVQRSTEQGKRLYAMYSLAVNAGLRTVELSRANIHDLDIRSGQAYLLIWGKGHTEPDQRKALAPEVYAAIKDYLAARSDRPTGKSPLFVSTGNRSGGKRIAPTTISTMLKQAMKTAGYNSERITAHSLRHTAGQSIMAITGNNIYEAQLYMRHSSPKTTEVYLDNDKAAQDAQLAARLYAHYHGAPVQAPGTPEALTAVKETRARSQETRTRTPAADREAMAPEAARETVPTADGLPEAFHMLTPEQREQLAMLADAMAANG